MQDIENIIKKLIGLPSKHRISEMVSLWSKKQYWLFEATYMGFRDGGVKMEKCAMHEEDAENTLTFHDFKIAYQSFAASGDKDALYDTAETASMFMWNEFYRRILMQDINWVTLEEYQAITDTILLNDQRIKEFSIPVFKLGLGQKTSKNKIYGELICEPVLPGERVVIEFKQNTTAIVYDRYGKVLNHPTIDTPVEFDFVLDCVYQDGTYMVSDIIPLGEFHGEPTTPADMRMDLLIAVFYGETGLGTNGRFSLIEKRVITVDHDDPSSFMEYFKEIKKVSKQVLAKLTDSVYVRDTNSKWFVINV